MSKSTKLYTKTLTLPDGRRKFIRAKTKEEVETKLLVAKMQLKEGVDISDTTTVAELAQLWYDVSKKDVLREKSLDAIKDTLNRYILPELGRLQVRNVKPIQIQKLMQSVAHLSKSTQRKILQYTGAIFQLAVDNRLITHSPVVSSIKARGASAVVEEPLTPEQTKALLTATKDTRVYPFIVLALFAGLRKGEILGLRWEDFDFNRGELTVSRSIVYTKEHREGVVNEDLKTDAAHRTIPLPLPVLSYFARLKEQNEPKSEYVLFTLATGSYLSEAAYNCLWGLVKRRSSKGSGRSYLPDTFDFYTHPHQLRHTCITRWFEAGLDIKQIQYLAGHASVEMTLRIYTHYDKKSRDAETAEKIRAAVPVTVAI